MALPERCMENIYFLMCFSLVRTIHILRRNRKVFNSDVQGLARTMKNVLKLRFLLE